METQLSAAEQLANTCAALGLDYKAEFVPFSKSRNAKKATKPSDYSLNWKITLSKGSRSLTTDYMQGIGHIPGYKQNWNGRISVDEFNAIKDICETGRGSIKKVEPPSLHDVMHSLVLDASALDAGSFEEWASDYGYETDSRSAEKIYNECIKIAIALRNIIGDIGINAIREAGQDH